MLKCPKPVVGNPQVLGKDKWEFPTKIEQPKMRNFNYYLLLKNDKLNDFIIQLTQLNIIIIPK